MCLLAITPCDSSSSRVALVASRWEDPVQAVLAGSQVTSGTHAGIYLRPYWHRLPIFQVDLHCALYRVATSSCRGHVDELATELFLLLHRLLAQCLMNHSWEFHQIYKFGALGDTKGQRSRSLRPNALSWWRHAIWWFTAEDCLVSALFVLRKIMQVHFLVWKIGYHKNLLGVITLKGAPLYCKTGQVSRCELLIQQIAKYSLLCRCFTADETELVRWVIYCYVSLIMWMYDIQCCVFIPVKG